jgi:hypothetical protein
MRTNEPRSDEHRQESSQDSLGQRTPMTNTASTYKGCSGFVSRRADAQPLARVRGSSIDCVDGHLDHK